MCMQTTKLNKGIHLSVVLESGLKDHARLWFLGSVAFGKCPKSMSLIINYYSTKILTPGWQSLYQ